MALNAHEIGIALDRMCCIIERNPTELRMMYLRELDADNRLVTSARKYIGIYLGNARDHDRLDLGNARVFEGLLDECISVLVGNWLDRHAPSELYNQLNGGEKDNARAATDVMEDTFAMGSRSNDNRSGGLAQGSRGGFGRGTGDGGGLSRQGGASGFFSGLSNNNPPPQSSMFGRVATGLVPGQENEETGDRFSRASPTRTGREEVRQVSVATSRASAPVAASNSLKEENKVEQRQVLNEAIWMDEERHNTHGLIRPMTLGDQQVRLFNAETAETYCQRASVMDAIRKYQPGKEHVVETDSPAPTTPIFLGEIIDVFPDVPAIVRLKSAVLQHDELANVDLSETPIFANSHCYHDWGISPEVVTDAMVNYSGQTHEENVNRLAKLEKLISLPDYRSMVRRITDIVNEWALRNSAKFEIESYVLDGGDIADLLKSRGNVALKQRWVNFASELAAYLVPVSLDVGNGEMYYWLNRCEAILKMPMRGVQFPIGASQTLSTPLLVSANTTPNLHRLLTNWHTTVNAAGQYTIVFEDGRTIGMYMDSGRPMLYALD
jgi:hypothetical protein